MGWPSLVSSRTTATTTRTVAGRFFALPSMASVFPSLAGLAGRQTGMAPGLSAVGIAPWLVCPPTTIMARRTVGGVSVWYLAQPLVSVLPHRRYATHCGDFPSH